MEMKKIGFELEVEEGAQSPSSREFIEALQQALPKEWWADNRCADWGVVALYQLNSDGSVMQYDSRLRPITKKLLEKRLAMTEALLDQERKVTAKLDIQLDEQRDEIAGLENTITDRNATQDDFAKRVRDLMVEKIKQATTIGDLYKQLDSCQADLSDKRGEIVDLRRHRDVTASQQKDTIRYQLKKIDGLEKEIRRVKDGWHKANMEIGKLQTIANSRKNTVGVMDRIIFEKEQKLTAAYAEIDELRDRGFTLSDETLTDLEELTTKVKNLVSTASAKATDAFVIIGDIDSVLDNIRTER